MSLFLASLGFGLVTAAVLAIAAVGFTMQFAVTDVLNLAYGAVMIASAFVAYALNQAGVNVWIGLLAAAAAGAVHLYDGINLAALAMVEANSTVPSVYAPFIEKIGDGTPGAVVVYSFAQGLAALKAGKAIRYEGPGGPTSFDSFHDSTGIFQIDAYNATGAVQVTGNITATQLRALA